MKGWTERILRHWRIDASGLALVAALTAVAYLLEIRPVLSARQAAGAGVAELAEKRRRAAELEGALRSQEEPLSEAQRLLAALDVRLEDAGRLNERVAKLTEMAGQSGLQVDGIEPGKVVGISGARYRTVSIRLTGRGVYRNCARFLRDISEKVRDSSVTQISLSGQNGVAEANATFAFDLLWYTAPEEVGQAR